MSSENDTAILVENLSKCYRIYDKAEDRLKQMLLPNLQKSVKPFIQIFNKSWQMKEQYFNEFWALKDINFELKKNQMVGIIGRNGSGKSTLLQLICHTLSSTTGTVSVQGKVAALLELGSGFNPEFTGRENVYLNAAILGLSKEETDERYHKILEFSEIGDFINQPVKTYSSGMYVRLAFAVIAHVDADILIVDEALSVGDAFFQQKCMRFINAFKEKGTILFVSHDTQTISNMCSFAIWLDEGRMKAIGDAKSICEQYYGLLYHIQNKLSKQGTPVDEKKEESTLKESTKESLEVINNIPNEHFEKAAEAKKEDKTADLNEQSKMLSKESEINTEANHSIIEQYNNFDSFGTGQATILEVNLLDKLHHPLIWIEGGEEVLLVIKARANQLLTNPIIGFVIKDRLGQYLFGYNTFDAAPNLNTKIGDILEATFSFKLPRLQSGQYTIAPAIATGTLDKHIQHHWVHDAFAFTVHSKSTLPILINVPMDDIKLNIQASKVNELV